MTTRGVFAPVSREGALLLNNLLLAVACFVVFIGTIWPLVAEMLWDRRLSVGAPFFEKAFTPFMIVLAMALPIGSILPWKRGRIGRANRTLMPAMILTLAVAALVYAVSTGNSGLAVIGTALGTWIIAGAAVDIWQRAGGQAGRLARLPRADWGRVVAHAGLGVTFIGVSLLMAWSVEDIRVAREGESFEVGGYQITLEDVSEMEGPNYISTTATLRVSQDGREIGLLHPEKRVYPVQAMPTTEAAIRTSFVGDIYLVIGDEQQGGGWAVRSYIKPFAFWIWMGSGLMALGGLISLTDRRWRVAAVARKPVPRAVAAE